MGVYIKGMKKPNHCYCCKAWCLCWDEKPFYNMIKSTCPLVEVKEPHGRLVDIDRAISVIAMNPDMPTSELREACTVIEAEGE